VLFIRHACSMFNLWGKWNHKVIREEDMEASEISFIKSVKGKFDIKFLDVPLCAMGRAEAEAAQKVVSKLPIKYIISSPLKRALETTNIIFARHPQEKEIKVIVHPMIRECISNPDDIPDWTLKNLKEKYKIESKMSYDFTMLEVLHPALYFLDTLQPELKETVMEKLKVVGEDKYAEVLVELMVEKYNSAPKHHKRFESNANGRKRGKLFLEWLKKFIEEKELKENEIAVVTHYCYLQCLAAKEFDKNGKPVYPAIPNAKPFVLDIDELLLNY